MTLICYDGRIVAADTQVSREGRRLSDAQKLQVVNRKVYGYTGVSSLFWPMVSWAALREDDRTPDRLPKITDTDENPQVIEFAPGRREALMFEYKIAHPSEYIAPDGWGASVAIGIAIGAMLSGMNAVAAMALVIDKVIYVGGMIDYVDLTDPELRVCRVNPNSLPPSLRERDNLVKSA